MSSDMLAFMKFVASISDKLESEVKAMRVELDAKAVFKDEGTTNAAFTRTQLPVSCRLALAVKHGGFDEALAVFWPALVAGVAFVHDEDGYVDFNVTMGSILMQGARAYMSFAKRSRGEASHDDLVSIQGLVVLDCMYDHKSELDSRLAMTLALLLCMKLRQPVTANKEPDNG